MEPRNSVGKIRCEYVNNWRSNLCTDFDMRLYTRKMGDPLVFTEPKANWALRNPDIAKFKGAVLYLRKILVVHAHALISEDW